jgi:hypothetical protein
MAVIGYWLLSLAMEFTAVMAIWALYLYLYLHRWLWLWILWIRTARALRPGFFASLLLSSEAAPRPRAACNVVACGMGYGLWGSGHWELLGTPLDSIAPSTNYELHLTLRLLNHALSS